MSAPVQVAATELDCVSCRALSVVSALIAGGLFGAGLVLSGMTQPAKIIGFLDPTSGWDPSLAFVMGGAVAVYSLVFRLVRRQRRTPWFDKTFHLPTRADLDLPLIGGAALFGAGWGLGGYCPGPGLVSAAGGSSSGLMFLAAMLVGMLVQQRLAQK